MSGEDGASRGDRSADLRRLLTGGWRIDRGRGLPAYAQIEERLRALIVSGALGVGDRVPSERDLAEWVGVSRLTARAALSALAADGVLERGSGRRGTVVAPAKLVYDLDEFVGFTDMAARQGIQAGARVRELGELPAPDAVARELGIAPGEDVFRVQRIRYAEGEPLTLEDSWIPAGPFPGLLGHDMGGSLYALMRERFGTSPVRASERLEPTVADERQAGELGVAPGSPLMLVVRSAFSADGTALEFARDHHRGDRARFVVHVSAPRPGGG